MTLREKVAAALYEDSCREDNAESMNGFLSWDEFVEINGKRSKTVLRYFRRADAALAVIQEEARKTDTANCPRCGFAVGLVGACMAEGCPCPLLAASPLAEGNGDG